MPEVSPETGGTSMNVGSIDPAVHVTESHTTEQTRTEQRVSSNRLSSGEPTAEKLSTAASNDEAKIRSLLLKARADADNDCHATPQTNASTSATRTSMVVASGNSSPSSSSHSKKKTRREVDFYRAPTILSRLILHHKYAAATQRVHRKPRESRTWVVIKKKHRSKQQQQHYYSLRQLPIHMACANLVTCHDETAHRQLNELIHALVVADPPGAFLPDHDGRQPLFDAVFHGATVETISIFLMADPAAVQMTDPVTGRTLHETVEHRAGPGREEIRELLRLGQDFWQKAHDEAELRLKAGNKDVNYPSAQVPVDSVGPLGTGAPEDDTLASAEPPSTVVTAPNYADDETVPPITWSQLERRAQVMEHCLTEVNEKNYTLNKKLAEISQGKNLSKEVTALNQENLELSEKLQALQEIMTRTVGMPDGSSQDDESTLAGLGASATLNQKYDMLYDKFKEQKESIYILQAAFAALVTNNSDEGSSDFTQGGGTGRASSITWSDLSSQEYAEDREKSSSPRRSAGDLSGRRRSRGRLGKYTQSQRTIDEHEVQWMPQNPRQTYMEIDTMSAVRGEEENLSVIFRAAADQAAGINSSVPDQEEVKQAGAGGSVDNKKIASSGDSSSTNDLPFAELAFNAEESPRTVPGEDQSV